MVSTTAVQDYLKAIHQLGGTKGFVPTTALAERLDVRPASVSGMLRRLDDQGLVTHERYKGVRLTKRGAREAVEMIRHHRLLELYLAEVVGLPLDKVHAEADALEHHISEDLESRLDELLGHPTADPHGHPIPTPRLVLREQAHASLAETEAGTTCEVRSIADDDPELLRYLDGLGVRPGVAIEVIERVPFGGGARVRIAGRDVVMGADAAAAVRVSEEG